MAEPIEEGAKQLGASADSGIRPRKRPYFAPTLIRWGAVEDLTAAAGTVGNDDGSGTIKTGAGT